MNRRTFLQWLGGIGAVLVAPKVAAPPDDKPLKPEIVATNGDCVFIGGTMGWGSHDVTYYTGTEKMSFKTLAEAFHHARAGDTLVIRGSYNSTVITGELITDALTGSNDGIY